VNTLFPDAQTWLPFIDAVVKSSILLLAGGLITLRLRRSSAAVRHLVWTAALVSALVLPAMSLVLPRWEAPVVTLARADLLVAAVPPAAAPSAPVHVEATRQQATASGPAASISSGAPAVPALPWPTIAAIVWIAGAVLILARLLVGILFVQLLARRSADASGAPWLPMAREIAAELGISRVRFRRGARAMMPMAWGVVRPVVLMPADADRWPEQRVRVVLLHELAHVKRADCFTHLLAQAACAVYWMNPLAWIAARRARTERERACDDLVLSRGMGGPDYAAELLQIARSIRKSRAIAAASLAMAHRSQLEGRLMSILDPTVPREGVSRLRAAGISALALAVIVPLSTMQTWAFDDGTGALIPRLQAGSRPQPQSRPQPEPNAVAAPAREVATEATQGLLQGVAQGVIDGVAGSVSQAVARGVGEGIGEAVAQGVGRGVGQGIGQGSGQASGRREADPKLVAALTEALKDSDKGVRETAMHALVMMRAPGVFEPLMQALKDPSPDLREKAAFGLGQLRDTRAVAPLTAALKDESAGVREQAAFALGQLDDPATAGALIAALKDESASVREQAAFALGQLEAKDAVDPLIAALKDPSSSVKEQAVFALGQIGDSRATDALIALLKDPNAQVRQQAAFALSQLR
jgi:beta-lactamase regulating signal transducer with metallopeptidase domain